MKYLEKVEVPLMNLNCWQGLIVEVKDDGEREQYITSMLARSNNKSTDIVLIHTTSLSRCNIVCCVSGSWLIPVGMNLP